MDGQRFDEVARTFAGLLSRRGFVAAGLGGIGLVARRHGAGAACPPDQIARSGMCICRSTGRPPDQSGYCPCPAGKTRCGDDCVDLTRDPAHCGACGSACQASSGVAAVACRRGTCELVACAPGKADCDGDFACETTLGTDANCGGCGDTCSGFDTCGGGGIDGVCGCIPTVTVATCDWVTCGEIPDGCGGTVICGCEDSRYCVDGQCVECRESTDCPGYEKPCLEVTCAAGRCNFMSANEGGTCGADNYVCQGGDCVCVPSCPGDECGVPDGCGGTCVCPPVLTLIGQEPGAAVTCMATFQVTNFSPNERVSYTVFYGYGHMEGASSGPADGSGNLTFTHDLIKVDTNRSVVVKAGSGFFASWDPNDSRWSASVAFDVNC